jgi:hypothetical protein
MSSFTHLSNTIVLLAITRLYNYNFGSGDPKTDTKDMRLCGSILSDAALYLYDEW